jgi:hypothetical protein
MAAEEREGIEPLFRSYAELWLGLWRHTAAMREAGLKSAEMLWGLQRPSNESLAALSRTLDGYMRSPAFLQLLKHSLSMMSGPECSRVPVPPMPVPVPPVSRRPTP